MGTDDRFGFKDNSWCRDSCNGAQSSRDAVNFGLILTICPHPLPDKRDRVESEHFNSLIGQKENDVGVFKKHFGIPPIDIPLIIVERCPNPTTHFRYESEVAVSRSRKYLW